MNKSFSKDLYNQYNAPAIQAGIELCQQLGYILKDQSEQYTHDIILTKNNKDTKFEVEVTSKWLDTDFPYPIVHVPFRKLKNKSNYYLRFNSTYTRCLATSMKRIKQGKVITSSNAYMKNETFLGIPPNEFVEYKKINNEWVRTIETPSQIQQSYQVV